MNFNVDTRYSEAVNKFTEVTLINELPLSHSLETLVREVSEKIIAASDLKSTLQGIAGRDLSLREVFYIITQDSDKRYGKNTPEKIENALPQEKEIVTHVVTKLSQDFLQVTRSDLTAATLLFGIHRIHELALETIIAHGDKVIAQDTPNSSIEAMEKNLNALIAMRNRYPDIIPENESQSIKDFMAKVDAQIQNTRTKLNALKQVI